MFKTDRPEFYKSEFGKRFAERFLSIKAEPEPQEPMLEERRTNWQSVYRGVSTLAQARPDALRNNPSLDDVAASAEGHLSPAADSSPPDFDSMFSGSSNSLARQDELENIVAHESGISSRDFGQNPKHSRRFAPTWHDLVAHMKYQGVVGEEALACKAMAAAIEKKPFGIEGYSRSGKSLIADRIAALLPDVYVLNQASRLAIFKDSDKINKCQYLFIKELQKALQERNSPLGEVFKDFGDGNGSSRIVTRKDGNGVDSELLKNKPIIYTLASENDCKLDEEMAGRVIIFYTDTSQEHIAAIHNHIADESCTIESGHTVAYALESALRNHIHECIAMKDTKVIDPFSYYLARMIPKTQKSIAYIQHYKSMIKGCVKFNHHDRMPVDFEGKAFLFANLEDHYFMFESGAYKEIAGRLKEHLTKEDAEFGMIDADARPDWKEIFESGYDALANNPKFEPIRRRHNNLASVWADRQIRDGAISTVDYKTGNLKAIATFSDQQPPLPGICMNDAEGQYSI